MVNQEKNRIKVEKFRRLESYREEEIIIERESQIIIEKENERGR